MLTSHNTKGDEPSQPVAPAPGIVTAPELGTAETTSHAVPEEPYHKEPLRVDARLEWLRRYGLDPHAFVPGKVVNRRTRCAHIPCGLNRSHIAHDADLRGPRS